MLRASLHRIGLAIASATVVLVASTAMASALTEDSVEFQDGAGNPVAFLSPGDVAVFYVRDTDRGTSGACTGVWTDIGVHVEAGTRLNLATGAPDPAAYSLSEGCSYNTDAPAGTPLRLDPMPSATVDGVPSMA